MSAKYVQYRKLLEKKQYIEASHLAELEYREGNPNNPFWLTRQSAALSRAGDYDGALKVGQQALQLQPSNPYAILSVAEALAGRHQYKEALVYFEEITSDPKLSVFGHKGSMECLAALKDWTELLQRTEDNALPEELRYRWKATALQGQCRMDEALDACRQWLQSSPDNTRALWNLTELEIKRDGLESVLARMRKIAKIPSRSPVYKEIYASLCRRAGKPELAMKQYVGMTQIKADPRIYRKQAFTLAKSGREPEAIPLMEELLKLNPKDFYLHSAYIPACRRAGQLDRALTFYEELIETHPEEKQLYGRIRKIKNPLEKK